MHPCTFTHLAKPHTRQHQVEPGQSRPSRWIPGTHVSRLISLSVTSSNTTAPRHYGGYFKMFLVIEASRTAVMTHGSAFSDDNSATVSFIPSLVLGLIHLNEKAQMEHNGQDLSQSSWHGGGGKWRKRRITQCFWLGLQASGGGDGTQSLDGKSGSRSTHLHRQLPSWGVNWGGSWPSSCGSVDILHIPIQRRNLRYCISPMKASILYDLMCLNRKYLSTVSSKSLRRKNLPKDMLVLST